MQLIDFKEGGEYEDELNEGGEEEKDKSASEIGLHSQSTVFVNNRIDRAKSMYTKNVKGQGQVLF